MAHSTQIIDNADIDRDTPQPEIHVEERRLKLDDFLKTAVKINGSDLHLQAGSIPMIRVDGRARFLDVPPLTDDAMKEYVDQIINIQQEPAEKQSPGQFENGKEGLHLRRLRISGRGVRGRGARRRSARRSRRR